MSVFLVMLFVLSLGGNAMAARVADWTDAVPAGTTGGNTQVGEGDSFASGGTFTGDVLSGQVQTDVWLRSVASAQIDATVPLVVLVTMNVGGGAAIAPGADYQIVNNGFVDINVTNVKVEEKTSVTIQLVDDITGLTVKDRMQAEVAFPSAVAGTATNLNAAKAGTGLAFTTGANNLIEAATVVAGVNTPTAKEIGLEISTTPLSFITSAKDEQTSEEIGTAYGDADKGVHVFNIKYTLSATYAAIGTDLPDPTTDGYDDIGTPDPNAP